MARQQKGNVDDEKMPPSLQWQEDDDVMPPLHDRDGYDSDSLEDEEETATGRIKVAFKGLAAPQLLSTQPVTDASKEIHRLENKQRRKTKQTAQEPIHYWESHQGQYSIPTPKQGPQKHTGSMCSSGLALYHLAAETLLNYAAKGCSTNTGIPWTRDEMEAAVA